MKRFREGGFNTLVSTCVGEEGLDIGEIDLVNDTSKFRPLFNKNMFHLVLQACQTGGQRAACDPIACPMRPAAFLSNLKIT